MNPLKNTRAIPLMICGLLAVTQSANVWAQVQSHATVVNAAKQAFARPLRETKPIAPHSAASVVPEQAEDRRLLTPDQDADQRALMHVPPADLATSDAALQEAPARSDSSLDTPLQATAGLDILGLGSGFPGYTIQDGIPSTNGAVGTTQYVQFVNNSFAIFNKSNGSLIYGPANMNTLWQSLGAPCSTSANMDGIAQFDKQANVWVMLMPLYTAPSYLCIAVSTTSDATGSWHLYAFEIPGANFCHCRPMPDYPKLAVWSDAYYVSYHQAVNNIYEGPVACAVNRSAMLTGAAATMQCFAETGTTYNAWLPSDLDGAAAPPSGSPNYFLAFDPNDQSLDLWQFHVDWNIPSDSTFTGPTNIPVTAFLEPCGDTVTVFTPQDNCIPQAGTTELLEAFGDELMYRVAYRNFGSSQALVANHTVRLSSGSNQTGLRWYELTNSGSGFVVNQSGTYGTMDSNYRWMGSIAMDHAGDIAIGYNVSGSSMSPSIRYTGRIPTDTPGTMETETDVLAAAGVQPSSLTVTSRWGDYAALAVDPSDDCTFWYTTEYIPPKTTHWATRINSFSFPNCAGAAPAWTVVNKASNGGTGATSLTIPTTGSGNLIAFAVAFNGGTSVSSVSDNAGNTYASAGARISLSSFSVEIWYAVTSKPGATVITPKFAGSATYVEMGEWEVSGLANSGPDAASTSTGNVSSNTPGAAVTTTGTGDFVVSVMVVGGASTSITGISSGNDFTNDSITGGYGWAHITSDTSSPGVQQASWTASSAAGKYLSSTAAFFAAP